MRRRTILVVDDEELLQAMMRRWLDAADLSMLSARSGPEAIALFATHREHIDVVVVDLQMPGMLGDELVGHLRAVAPDVTVLATSGYDESNARAAFERARVDDFLPKPFRAPALVAKLHHMLVSRAAPLVTTAAAMMAVP